MSTEEERAAVAKVTLLVREEDWRNMLGIMDLRDRVAALEAAAAKPVPDAEFAPAVLTVEELADCLPANAWAGPEGYSRQAFARYLLDHPRIGALLCGEGAGALLLVVLPEEPIMDAWPGGEVCGEDAVVRYAWAAARAEVDRQQQGGKTNAL